MPRVLTKKEVKTLEALKDAEILRQITDEVAEKELGIGEDSVVFACSDDNTDMIPHLIDVLAVEALHRERIFGGPLVIAKSYKKYNPEVARWLIEENLRDGMLAKHAKQLFVFLHAPCGMLDKCGHTISDAIAWAIEIEDFIKSFPFYDDKKIHMLFHVKWRNGEGAVEQSTYIIEMDKLREYVKK